eukprot:CAMPEP_0185323260 /NCGR_PEP_ID=MMETSP1363-20130426/61401_1 /TAXON_ID=38817 /ORGANISM="Gephyrocapsa oceanica, Strain RCC1303" /LENGTH=39 /DNA_ID= /DNA_START= /DNA_END= /DNA_ORIENTATION=
MSRGPLPDPARLAPTCTRHERPHPASTCPLRCITSTLPT